MSIQALEVLEAFGDALQCAIMGGPDSPAILVDFGAATVLLPQGEFYKVLICEGTDPRIYKEIVGLLVRWDSRDTFWVMQGSDTTKYSIAEINKRFS